tara:strand:- start:156 stop:413 length:258 start_codon:yes stop_codon:yes gene_type:complete
MSKIQMLSVYDIKNKTVKEKRFFNSVKKAEKSKENITKILIKENNIDLKDVIIYYNLNLTCLNNMFNVSLINVDIENEVLTFKRV